MSKRTDAGRKALEENRKRTEAAFKAAKQSEEDAAFRASEKARLEAEAAADWAAKDAKRKRNTPQAKAQRLAETKAAQEAKQKEAKKAFEDRQAHRDYRRRQREMKRSGGMRKRPVSLQEAISQAADIRQRSQERADAKAKEASKTQIVDAAYDASGKIDTSGLEDNTIVRTPQGTFKKYNTETGGLTDVAFDPISDQFGLPEQPKAGAFDTEDFTRNQLTELRKLGQTDARFADMFSDFQSRQLEIMRDPNLRPQERQAALQSLSDEIGDTYGMTAGYRRDLVAAENMNQQEQARIEQAQAVEAQADKVALIRREMRETRRVETERRRQDDVNSDSALYTSMQSDYASMVSAIQSQNADGMNPQPVPTFEEFRTNRLRQHSEDRMHIRQLRSFDDEIISLQSEVAVLDEEYDDLNQFRNRLERQGVPMVEALGIAAQERERIDNRKNLINLRIRTIDQKREDFLQGLQAINARASFNERTAGLDRRAEFGLNVRSITALTDIDGGTFNTLGRGTAQSVGGGDFALTSSIKRMRKTIREGGDGTFASDQVESAVREALFLYKAAPQNLAGDRAIAKSNFANDYNPIIPLLDEALTKAGYSGRGPVPSGVLNEASNLIRLDIQKSLLLEKADDSARDRDQAERIGEVRRAAEERKYKSK